MYRTEEYSKGILSGGTLFEELGFYYLGPIDGHNVKDLVSVLENIRDNRFDKPVFTLYYKKGKGYSQQKNQRINFMVLKNLILILVLHLKKSIKNLTPKYLGKL